MLTKADESNSFHNQEGAGQVPPGSQQAGPGLLVLNKAFAEKLFRTAKNEKRRKARLARKREFYAKKAEEQGYVVGEKPRPRHPHMSQKEARALEEAINLA